VTLLTSTAGKDVTAAMLERILDTPASTSGSALVASGLRLDEDAIKADPAQALWLFAQMVAAVRPPTRTPLPKQRPRLCAGSRAPIPHAAATPVVFDGPAFSPNDIPSYLAALEDGRTAHDLYAAQHDLYAAQ